MTRLVRAGYLAAFFSTLSAGAALADGYPPFYGYSGYYGGPATHYTRDSDVHQATTQSGGPGDFGYVTYSRGGPFWTYEPVARREAGPRERSRARRSAVLRRRG